MTTVLFCPFCREPFEGVSECPDHGVQLVTLSALSDSDARKAPSEDDELPLHDLRFGRGIVLTGAVVTWIGMWLPAVHDGFRDGVATSGFALWHLRADYLTVVPGAALISAFAAMTRSTRAELRRVRLAVGIAVALGVAAMCVAAVHVVRYAERSRAAGEVGELEVGSGAYLAVLGLALLAFGAARLGGPRT